METIKGESMKRFLLGSLLCTIVLAFVCSAQTEDKTFTVNDEFSVSLATSGLTGLHYNLNDDYDKTIVQLVKEETKGPPTGTYDAPSTHIFRFRALKPGKTTITFPGEDRWEDKTYKVNVTVKE
jgi:predicted secreted protein